MSGWRTNTDAVHSAGERMFLQLWHMGHVSHPDKRTTSIVFKIIGAGELLIIEPFGNGTASRLYRTANALLDRGS